MSDPRILILASVSKLDTLGGPNEPESYAVRASAKGLSATAKVKTSESEAAQRALTNLLGKVDAIAALTTRLGPKPAPQKPRGISATRARQARGMTELTLSDGTVLEVPDETTPNTRQDELDKIITTMAGPDDEGQDVDMADDPAASNPHLTL